MLAHAAHPDDYGRGLTGSRRDREIRHVLLRATNKTQDPADMRRRSPNGLAA
jgi:hypothetical protein